MSDRRPRCLEIADQLIATFAVDAHLLRFPPAPPADDEDAPLAEPECIACAAMFFPEAREFTEAFESTLDFTGLIAIDDEIMPEAGDVLMLRTPFGTRVGVELSQVRLFPLAPSDHRILWAVHAANDDETIATAWIGPNELDSLSSGGRRGALPVETDAAGAE